jgi:hypothetical protein
VYCATIDDQLAFDVLLQNDIDCFVHCGIVAKTHENNVGPFDGIVDGINHLGLAGAHIGCDLRGEVIGALLGPVVDDQWLIELAFFYQI